MDLFNLYATITLKDEYTNGIERAKQAFSGFSDDLDTSYNNIDKVASALSGLDNDANSTSSEIDNLKDVTSKAGDDLGEMAKAADGAGNDVGELEKGIGVFSESTDKAGTKTSNFADKLKSGLTIAAKVSADAITAVANTVKKVSSAVFKQASEIATYGDNIDKMSQKMGLSAEAYQEWDAIMQHSGTSIESLQSGMKTLANAVENGNDAFSRLGITQEQISSMDNEELFSATIAALQNVDNETERTYLAGQLLGRGATELGALLNTSAEDTEAMRRRVHELGGVMSDEAVKAAAKYQDSLQDMQTAFSGLSRNMMSDFLPSITLVMDGITEIFSGDSDNGITMISNGLNGFISGIMEKTPKIISAGSQIISSLLSAILQNAPMLITSGVELIGNIIAGLLNEIPSLTAMIPLIIGSLVSTLTKMFPQILSTGSELLDQLVIGIEEGLPDMIERLPQIIEDFLNFITENLPKILKKGTELLNGLTTGIIEAIPKLVAKLPQIIRSFVDFITENLPEIVQSGLDILLNLIKGIIDAIPDLVAALPDLIVAIVDGIGDLLDMIWDVGEDIVGAIWDGIESAWDGLVSWFNGIWDSLFGNRTADITVNQHTNYSSSMTSSKKVNGSHAFGLGYVPFDGYIAELHRGEMVLPAKEAAQLRKSNAASYSNISITVNGAKYNDEETLTEAIAERLQNLVDRKEAAWA